MAPLGSCRLYPTEPSLLVERRAGKRLEKPFGSGVFCSLFQIHVLCLLRNDCSCRAAREQE